MIHINVILLITISLILYIWFLNQVEYYNQILRYRHIPDFTRWILTDKYVAKQYAALLGFEIPKTYMLVKYPSQIISNFENKLSNLSNYVIKPVDLCNSGGVYLIKDSINLQNNKPVNLLAISQELTELRSKIENEYYMHDKMYHGLVPYTGYIVEELLLDKKGNIPCDYKCYVFGGKLYFTAMTFQRRKEDGNQKFNSVWLDSEGKPIRYPMIKKGYQYKSVNLPPEYSLMKELVEKAGKTLARHCRIDVYLLDGKVYLGEFTFFCGAKLHTKVANLKLGWKWRQHPDDYTKEDGRIRKLVPEFYNLPK